KSSRRPCCTFASTAANCGVRWWMTGCAIAAITSGGTGVGPGASKYDLITMSPEPRVDLDLTAGPRRSARWSLCTPPWSVPRQRQACEGGDVGGGLAPGCAHCQGESRAGVDSVRSIE